MIPLLSFKIPIFSKSRQTSGGKWLATVQEFPNNRSPFLDNCLTFDDNESLVFPDGESICFLGQKVNKGHFYFVR